MNIPHRVLCVLAAACLAGGLYAQSNEAPRAFQFRLRDKAAVENATVLFKTLDLFLVADKAGDLYSPLEPGKKQFEFTNGRYPIDVVIAGRTTSQVLVVDGKSSSPITLEATAVSKREDRARTLDAIDIAGGNGAADLSRSVMTAAEARSIPGSGGDALRGLVNFPGVAPTGFGSALYIRGGDRNDLLYTYDGVRIANPFHNLGFYSVFPTSSLESINFYPGAFPVRFGNSQGAVIELLSKTSYDKSRLTGELDANLAVAGGSLSIPLGPYFQLSIGGRRTYYEFYLGLIKALPSTGPLKGIRELLSGFDTIPYFHDANAKLEWQPNPEDSVSLFGILSKDALTLNSDRFPDPTGDSSNVFSVSLDTVSVWDTEGLVWRHMGKRWQNTATVFRGYSSNSFLVQGVDLGSAYSEKFSVVDDSRLVLGPKATLGLGFEYGFENNPITASTFVPSTNTNTNSMQGFAARIQDFLNPKVETNRLTPTRGSLAGYAEGVFLAGPLEFVPGVRITGNSINGKVDVDPRLAVTWKASPVVDVFAKAGKYSQLPGLESVATNYGDTNLGSAYAWHYDLGVRYSKGPLELKLEGYYKDLREQVGANPTWDFFFPTETNNPRFIGGGSGRAYGLEVLARRQLAQGFFGWVSYSLSRSERFDQVKSTNASYSAANLLVNNGMDYTNLERVWRTYAQDVTHNLILIASYDIVPRKFKVGARVNISTGKPYTDMLVTKNSNTGELSLKNSDDVNGARYPTQFTLDLRLDYTWHLGKKVDLSLYLDVWNVQFAFGHTNVSSYQYKNTGLTEDMVGQPAPRTAVGGLPILPLLGLNLTF